MNMHGGTQAASERAAASTPAMDVRQIILRAAQTWPARTAVRGEDAALTYEQLGLLVYAAAELCEGYGLGSGDIVGLALARSATSAAIFLALMAAGVSVSFLPDAPISRLRRDVEELGIHLIIADRESPLAKLGTRFADPSEFGKRGGMGALFALPATAYLTLTSGSTGRPKAVMVSHANIAHYAEALVERLGLTPDRALRFAQLTTLAADLGYTAIFPTLLVGGQIVIAPDSIIRQPDAFWAWVRQHRVSAVKTTPSHFQALLEGRRAAGWAFGQLILGGERLGLALARAILASGCTETLVNHYGPSETTIGVCCHVMRSEHDFAGWSETVPIGSSFGRGELTLKDASREPDGCEVGELVVRGPGVSLGYFGRPELTAERFEMRGGVTHGYRTGDICRRSRSGLLQFLGRKDRQIKVRGFIVNPPEIETVIEDLPGVRKAAVLAYEHNGLVRLACAIELERDPQDLLAAVAEFRETLKERLPHWMVPSRILPLPSMPLTQNGKLDYAVIEELINTRPEGLSEETPSDGEPDAADHPQLTLAKRIAEVWSDLLGVPLLALEADIFAAGADSIMLMRSVARLRAEEWRTTLLDIHEHPTPLALATYLLAKPAKTDTSPVRASGERVLSPMQGWLFRLDLDEPDHFNQSVLLHSSSAVDAVALCKAMRHLCERHELLCQSFEGALPGEVRRESALAAFGITMLPVDVAGRERVIASVSAELHRSLRLVHGTVTKAHLFKSEDDAGDRILLVVHHLATDGVSWRILLEELGAAYTACLAGEPLKLPAPASFWDWTAESARRRGATAVNHRKSAPSRLFTEAGRRGGVESLVLALGVDETKAIVESAKDHSALEALLLQGFVDGVGAVTSAAEVTVDVEGHGRTNVQDVERYYGTIGWFTSVEQVDIAPGGAESFTARARAAQDLVAESLDEAVDARSTLAELCFNFLGSFTSPVCSGLDWEPATEPHGPTRSNAVDRIYACRLTARIAGGRLTIDLVHDLARVSAEQADRMISVLRQRLGVVVARDRLMGDLTREYQSTSGLLLLSRAAATISSAREPRPVLVTGATGYLGLHLIHQLLRAGELQPICLVRGASEAAARNRVLELYARYFGEDAAARASRLAAFVCGDVREPDLGLPRSFAQKVTAVFHLAADTHLLGRIAELSKTNEGGTRRLVGWIAEHGNLPLHYVSTLAVAGKVRVARGFDETDFNIGQGFLSPYEASKFEAERVVRDSRASRSATYIYRMGHLAPDSRTGIFQANLGDNRVYQMIKSYALAGEIADDDGHDIAFSHVDIVANAIATIARSPHVPAGVFHVESPHTVHARELAFWLSRIGYRVSTVSPAQFTDTLVKRVALQDEVLASAALQWAERSKRNVVYDSTRTLRALSHLEIAFPRPDADWFARAIKFAIDDGFMRAPTAGALEHKASDGLPSELG